MIEGINLDSHHVEIVADKAPSRIPPFAKCPASMCNQLATPLPIHNSQL